MAGNPEKPLRWYNYISINIYWFALATRTQTILPLIFPLLVQQFVGEETKGTYLGIIYLWALMVALLWQAIMGIVSDHSTIRWGRRRPFILVGAIGEIIVFILIGFTAGLQGMNGFWVLFSIAILTMMASNTAQAGTQGLIPDLVPAHLRGHFSSIKTILETPAPLIFVSLVIGKSLAAGKIWEALVILITVILVCAALSMLTHETPLREDKFGIPWQLFFRLFIMTAVFTAIILITGFIINRALLKTTVFTQTQSSLLAAILGFVGMAIVTILGVWSGIRISLGKEARKNTAYIWWVITRLAFFIPSSNLTGFMVFFIQERFHEYQGEKAAAPTAIILLCAGIFSLLTALPSGWFADHFGKKPLVVVSGIMAACGTALIVLIPKVEFMYLGACMIGAAIGLFSSASWALGIDLVPREQAGRFLGLSNLAGAGSGAIGAYIGGPLADKQGYLLLFSIFAALYLLSSILMIAIKENKPTIQGVY